jgi:integrase
LNNNNKKIAEQEGIIESNLHSLKRPIEADPDQKWINTYNQRAMVISKFFRWLAYPDLRSEERRSQKPIPPAIMGIKTVKKKGPRSNVKATDLWTWEEDALFVKYVEDPRIACYHMMARDTSARPSEMLAIKIEDIKIKKTPMAKFLQKWRELDVMARQRRLELYL